MENKSVIKAGNRPFFAGKMEFRALGLGFVDQKTIEKGYRIKI